jgi:hypothetical protein
MKQKLAAILFIFIVFSQCSQKREGYGKFQLIDLPSEYEKTQTFWEDSKNSIALVGRYKDLGGMGHDYMLCFEKKINEDTVYYYLKPSLLHCRKIEVYGDTLFLFSDTSSIIVSTWFKKTDKDFIQGDYSMAFHDSANIRKYKLAYGGIYQWNEKELVKISHHPDSIELILSKASEGQIFYVPPPGTGIRYKYYLKDLAAKLLRIKFNGNVPEEL